MKFLQEHFEQLLVKMTTMNNGISRAPLILCLLVTLYIGLINIEVPGFEFYSPASRTMTKLQKTYDNGNCRQIEDDEANTGRNHHMVDDTDGVGVASGKYIPPVLKVPQDRDKDVAHEAPPNSGTPTFETKSKPTTLLTKGYLTTTWTSKISQWTVTKDGTHACFDVEAFNSQVTAESISVGIWAMWDVWLRQGCTRNKQL